MSKMSSKPIPNNPHQESIRKSVQINENGEALACINDLNSSARISVHPRYYWQKLPGAIPQCFARETVVGKLINAASQLPNGLSLVIWDCWRPFEVQRSLFDSYQKILAAQNPLWTEQELVRNTSKFVAVPSIDPHAPSPHVTGGAVDLSIVDESGVYLDMGTEFDDFSPLAFTRYYEVLFEKGARLSSEDQNRLENRRLLYQVMIEAGFTNYAEEWWHFDYGNQSWAVQFDTHAIYGTASLQSMDASL